MARKQGGERKGIHNEGEEGFNKNKICQRRGVHARACTFRIPDHMLDLARPSACMIELTRGAYIAAL